MATPRNALADAAQHGQQFKASIVALPSVPLELLDAAHDIGSLLDTWSKRNPLRVTSGERYMMHDIFRIAEDGLAHTQHAPEIENALADAEHLFNAAISGENILRPEATKS